MAIPKICPQCGKECKNLGAHVRLAHGKRATGGELLSSAPPSAPSSPEKARFLSTKAPFLTVVITPTTWQDFDTPSGRIRTQVEGKKIQFQGGFYETSDPEEIKFLTEQYKLKRLPIIRTS